MSNRVCAERQCDCYLQHHCSHLLCEYCSSALSFVLRSGNLLNRIVAYTTGHGWHAVHAFFFI